MSEVKVFKLKSGEEVIGNAETYGEILKEDSSPKKAQGWSMSKVCLVILQSDQTGNIGYALIPWIASNPNATIKIPNDWILFEIEPSKNVESAYVRQTTGIVTARPDQVPQPSIQLAK